MFDRNNHTGGVDSQIEPHVVRSLKCCCSVLLFVFFFVCFVVVVVVVFVIPGRPNADHYIHFLKKIYSCDSIKVAVPTPFIVVVVLAVVAPVAALTFDFIFKTTERVQRSKGTKDITP